MEVKEKYCFKRRLGSGAFNKVAVVQCIHTGDIFVAKSPEALIENTRTFAQTEASILRKLDSPIIPKLKETLLTEEGYISTLIIEYCPGSDLLTAISNKIIRCSEKVIQLIIVQLLEALEFIHQQQIIHLDINYNNIVISELISLKLIDFGLSRELPPQQTKVSLRRMVGTLEFMSPEVLKCDHASTASDMWSVGVLLYTLLSGGILPFCDKSKSRISMMRNISRSYFEIDIPQLGGLSWSAKDLVRRLLEFQPLTRLTAKKARSHEWFAQGSKVNEEEINIDQFRKLLIQRRWKMLKVSIKNEH